MPAFLVIVAELIAIVRELAQLWRRRVLASKRTRRRLSLAVGVSNPAHSIEYVRLFAMDDIFIPVRIFESRVRSLSAHHYTGALTSTLAVVCISLVVSFSNAGGTLSYFRDTETSTGNTFSAGSGWVEETSFSGGSGGDSGGQALTEGISEDTEGVIDENGTSEEVTREEEGNTPQVEEEGSVREERGERGEREERNDVTPVILEARTSVEGASPRPDLGDADSATNSDRCLGLECM